MGRSYAGILGTLAFVSVLARCLFENGAVAATLRLAIVCMFVFAALGYLVGQLADFVIWDAVRSRFAEKTERHATPPVSGGNAE